MRREESFTPGSNGSFSPVKNKEFTAYRTGEMGQWLRSLVALAEDPGLIRSPLLVPLNHWIQSVPGALFWPLQVPRTRYTNGAQ